MTRLIALLLCFVALTAQREPILVPEVSQNEVQVQQGFTGTELLLFGAILDPSGARAGQEYDIVVVLKGPTEPITLREKERFGPIWMNAQSTAFRSAPSFFAVVSSDKISDIVDDRTAAIYELDLDFIQLSPSGTIDPDEQQRFSEGLVDLKKRQGLYKEEMGGVSIREQVLYQARIALPSNVHTGTYTAETFAITRGRVIASAIAEVEVKKVGFEKIVFDRSRDSSFLYGFFAVLLSITMGWLAGRLFTLI